MSLRFSIVIINHNYGRYLETCINSALSQRMSADEVIVVDDGSTDNSRAMIESFGTRITPLFKPAGGHVSAANAGFAAATGDLLLFLDADDLLYPNCLETVLSSWHPSDVKLQFRLDTIDAAGKDQRMAFPFFPADMSPDSVRKQALRWGGYPWTVSSGNVFSRGLLEQLFPIDQAVIYRSPDGYISKMAPLFGDVRTIRDVLGAYRVHGANVWAQTGGDLQIGPIIQSIKFDAVLQQNFEAKAKCRGIEVAAPSEIRDLRQMENRLLVCRFAPGEFAPPASRLALLTIGRRLVWELPHISAMGRVVWMAWFCFIAVMPKKLVRQVYGMSRGQSGRSTFARLAVALSRGSSR